MHVFLRIISLCSFLFLTSIAPLAAQSDGNSKAEQATLTIGVRSEARPFSFRATDRKTGDLTAKSGPLRSQGYDGYMVSICDAVLKQMLIPALSASGAPLPTPIIKHVDIEDRIQERAELALPALGRIDLLDEGEFDILCDPATMTRDRVRLFATSPPVFLTGISYIQRKNHVHRGHRCGDQHSMIGLVGGTTAYTAGINAILQADELIRSRNAIQQALRNPTACSEENPGASDLIKEFANHADAAQAFCNGDIDYYIGDIEIIMENARQQTGCEINPGARTFTDDRYAIFARIDYGNPDKAAVIGRFFEILNRELYGRDSIVKNAYDATFPPGSKSRKLQLFFWGISGSTY